MNTYIRLTVFETDGKTTYYCVNKSAMYDFISVFGFNQYTYEKLKTETDYVDFDNTEDVAPDVYMLINND